MKDKVLEHVKLRLGIKDEDMDELIKSFIEETENKLLNVCNITRVPKGLQFTWISMVIELMELEIPDLLNDMKSNSNNEGDLNLKGATISIGDTSIKLGEGSGSGSSSSSSYRSSIRNKSVEDIIDSHWSDIVKYRKLPM